MSKLLDKVIANSTVKETTTFKETKFFTDKEQIRTDIPILNMACSGEFDGGFRSGLTVIAGPSKHFKSNLGLAYVRSYLNQHEDAVCLYYDSEFGSLPTYLHGMGIDTGRVVHTPVLHIEQLKFDLTKQITSLDREDKVIIFIDSLGNLASKKEADDALDGKSAADMTRAKQIKSLFRIATPHFTTKDIPCVCINHTYQTQEMYSKAVVSGGTGVTYSADTVFIIGRAQEKDGTGYTFTINIEKSRYVREKSKFPFTVTFANGVDKWSGLLDIAIELGFVGKDGKKYVRTGIDTDKKWWKKDTNCLEFWKPLMSSSQDAFRIDGKTFKETASSRYKLGEVSMFNDEESEDGMS